MEPRDALAGKTPEEQTEWLRTHMRNWDEFLRGISRATASLTRGGQLGTKAARPVGSPSKSTGSSVACQPGITKLADYRAGCQPLACSA